MGENGKPVKETPHCRTCLGIQFITVYEHFHWQQEGTGGDILIENFIWGSNLFPQHTNSFLYKYKGWFIFLSKIG